MVQAELWQTVSVASLLCIIFRIQSAVPVLYLIVYVLHYIHYSVLVMESAGSFPLYRQGLLGFETRHYTRNVVKKGW